jgi:2-polyprenyl-3-methyl-5-hydroxy-6-metoxy-1,4-benzoquinol methylase
MPPEPDYADRWKNEGLKGWEKLYEFTARTIYDSLLPHVKNRGSALEIGCGDGVNTVRIARDFEHTIVVDLSSQFIEMTKQRLEQELTQAHVEFACSPIEAWKPDHMPQVDAIFLLNVLEHVEFPIDVLFGLKKFLAPGGRMLISVPNANSQHRQLGVAMGLIAETTSLDAQDALLGHRRVYNMDALRATLRAAGLERGPFAGNFIKPLSARQMEEWGPAILEGLAKMGKGSPQKAADLCVAAWPTPEPPEPVL